MPTSPQSETVAPSALSTFFARLRPHFAALDSLLHEQLDSFEPEIRDLALYCVDTSGKRIRPALVFFSGWRGDEHVAPELVRVAAVVEMVHLATLVHDDIMDEADVRRGRTTASRKFGPETAVLLGDALFAHALSLASEFPTTEVCRHVSVSTRRVCAGEIMQTLAPAAAVRDLAYYRRVIDLKTAELFAVSCYLGARLSGSEVPEAHAIGEFGRHLGTAYQIYDDMADFTGDETSFGKTLGTDLASGKTTLPLLLLMEKLPADDADALRGELRAHDASKLRLRVHQMAELDVFSDSLRALRHEIDSGLLALDTVVDRDTSLLRSLAALLVDQAATLRPGAA
ncbi:polyprenyl synthetase family protein [Opitutales bacterium ASA1]|uniref:polyprenyl synthetase family protein n=1 Tax=Congregicoccus parvus TaxID=3081749 RepID=UPI002B2AAD83|nr:polyprenyl synthetase family protein [Opitutales bacterium ASA1]